MTTDATMDSRIDRAVREAEGRKRAIFDRMHSAEQARDELAKQVSDVTDERDRLAQERDDLAQQRDEAESARQEALSRAHHAEAERDRMQNYCERMLSAMSWEAPE